MTSAREVARRVLRRVEQGEAYATLALSGELERAGLEPRERAFATELVYGVLRSELRIDRALLAHAPRGLGKPVTKIALRVAAYQLLFLRTPAHAAVDEAVGSIKQTAGPKVASFANAVLRKIAQQGEPPLPTEPLERMAVEHSLPPWLAKRIIAAVGPAEAPEAAAAMNRPPPITLRVSSGEDVIEKIQAERPDAELTRVEGAIVTRGLGNPETLAAFQDGLVTVQDLAAQRVGRMLGIAPGEHVLDACAGVGGKSTHLQELAGGRATIDAMDLSRRKLDLAEDAARRLHLAGIRFTVADLTSVALGDYDRVLLDAPCSGLGVLRRHPEAKRREPDVAGLAALQQQLLEHIAPHAKTALVYSVCTFTDEEGPRQIARFLAAHPEWRKDEELRTWPHKDDADAFFAARLVRR